MSILINNLDDLKNRLIDYQESFYFSTLESLNFYMSELGYKKTRTHSFIHYRLIKGNYYSQLVFISIHNGYHLLSRDSGNYNKSSKKYVSNTIDGFPSKITYDIINNVTLKSIWFHDNDMFSIKHNPYSITYIQDEKIEAYTSYELFNIVELNIKNDTIVDGKIFMNNSLFNISDIHFTFPETLGFSKEQFLNIETLLSKEQLAILEMVQL